MAVKNNFFEIIINETTSDDCFPTHNIVSGTSFDEIRDFYMQQANKKYGYSRKTCNGFITEIKSDYPEDNIILEIKIYKIDIPNYKDNNIFDYYNYV